MERVLQPIPNPWVRWLLLGLLTLPALISGAGWFPRIVACAVVAFLVGTYRQALIHNDRFQTRLVVMFYPRRYRKWKLDRFVSIETDLETHAGWGTFFLFGPAFWLFSRACDWFLPWAGGDYRVWLRSSKGKSVLAWQGNSDAYFQANLKILQSATGAPIQRVSHL